MDMRFGLVGLGYHGQHAVLPSFDEPTVQGAVLTAVCDVCPANLDYVTLPVEKYLSAQEMIAKAPIDAVYVAVGCDQAKAIVLAALAAGKAVICDRFSDSTTAYQGGARKLPIKTIEFLNDFASASRKPDLTFLMDLPPETGFERIKKRESEGFDRFENENLDFHRAVRNAFLEAARKEPQRIKIM